MQKQLLIVSNDFTVRESLGGILEAADYAILFAQNGRDAVRTLRANPIRAIVLDFKTPFRPKGDAARPLATLTALTDVDPFLPLVLVCEKDRKLAHPVALMADLVLRHPVTATALVGGLDMLLAESLRDRVYRKAEFTAAG